MRIIILGKRDQMGTNPNIRVKGVSRLSYNFLWDPEIRHYAYQPQSQSEVNDIFRCQGRLYRSLYFSVWLDEELNVEKPKVEKPKVEKPKVEEPKVEEPKVEEPKIEEPKNTPSIKAEILPDEAEAPKPKRKRGRPPKSTLPKVA